MHDASCSLRFGNAGLGHARERFRRCVVRVQQEQALLSVGVLMCKCSVRVYRVAPVRLCDGFVAQRLGSATTKRSGDSNEIEPVILVGY